MVLSSPVALEVDDSDARAGCVGNLVRNREETATAPHHASARQQGCEARRRAGRSTACGTIARRFRLAGDPRASLRIAAAAVGAPQLPISLRLGAKFPGTDFPVDPNLLPLTEGQTDLEIALEGGRLLQALPLHVAGFIGYRWRLEDADRQRKPGDELFARLGAGGRMGAGYLELAIEGLRGGELEQQGLKLQTAQRRLVQLLPTIGWSCGNVQMEVTGRFNLEGRNLPSGSSFNAGVLVPWSLR